MKTLKAGAVYFGFVFGAGFFLGPVRILWLVPRVGERSAELIEAPVMLTVILLSAHWISRAFALTSSRERLGVGAVALLLLLGAEFSLVLALRQITIADYLAGRDAVAGMVYFLMLGVFALMPALLPRR